MFKDSDLLEHVASTQSSGRALESLVEHLDLSLSDRVSLSILSQGHSEHQYLDHSSGLSAYLKTWTSDLKTPTETLSPVSLAATIKRHNAPDATPQQKAQT
jgi:hypothetical protein